MIRTLDAAFLNGVANDPQVRPYLGGVGPIDLSGLVSDPGNITLVTDFGGWVLYRHEPGVYEAHTMFLPEGRGAYHCAAQTESLRYVFAATDAREIVTRVPASNKPAAHVARAAGFRQRFTRKDAWQGSEGLCDVAYFGMSIDDWIARDAECLAAGGWFHDKLEAAKIKLGATTPVHPDDEAHDRAVGASVLMMRAGNINKAVWSYNRWARLAGYMTIEALSLNPPIIDVRDAVIEVRGEDMEVLLCR